MKIIRFTTRTETEIAAGEIHVGSRYGGIRLMGLRCSKALRIPVPHLHIDMTHDEAERVAREILARVRTARENEAA